MAYDCTYGQRVDTMIDMGVIWSWVVSALRGIDSQQRTIYISSNVQGAAGMFVF